MNNKGTQALFCSDVSVVKGVANDALLSVSTTDIEGVKKLGLPLNKILPPMVDLPWDRADQTFKRSGGGRNSLSYKLLTVALLILMPLQTFLSLFSVLSSKLGFHPVYRGEVINCIKNSDLVISHSDENFKETATSLPLNPYWAITWWSMMFFRTVDVMVARSFHKPVVMFPNSVGPFKTLIGRFLAKLSLNSCDYLLIRDPISYDIVHRLGVRSTKVLTYDTALLFDNADMFAHRLNVSSVPTVGVAAGVYSNSMSRHDVENYIQAHAQALDITIEKHGVKVAFIPHYISGFSGDDIDISKRILEKMKNQQSAQLIITENVGEFKTLLSEMSIVISSKMHPAILAVTSFVPVLSIVYDHKQSGFFQRLEMADYTLDIRNVCYDNLFLKIDQTWAQKNQLMKQLEAQIPIWQNSVRSLIQRTVRLYIKK